MKLIIKDGRIVATATDAYAGPDMFVEAPAAFDISRMEDYRYESGELLLIAKTKITNLALRNRFSIDEKVAIELAAIDDPGAGQEARVRAATLRAILKDMEAASFIDLADPAALAGVHAIEAFGLIDEGRADEIIGAPVEPHEVA